MLRKSGLIEFMTKCYWEGLDTNAVISVQTRNTINKCVKPQALGKGPGVRRSIPFNYKEIA